MKLSPLALAVLLLIPLASPAENTFKLASGMREAFEKTAKTPLTAADPEGGYETGPNASSVAPAVEPVLMGAMKRLLEVE